MAVPTQPTGISTEAAGNSIIIRWFENPESDIKGYNIYNSTTSGGGVSGYVKLNSELISLHSSIEEVAENRTETIKNIGGSRTTTIVETITEVKVFSFNHTDLLDDKRQYYVITAVNNGDEESIYSIEIYDKPLVITTALVNFPVRTTSDVTRGMIDTLLERHPEIDVKPATMTRDIHIDPHAYEFGYLYIYINFLSRSQSFLTLLEIDDPDNTGKSIAVFDSTYKQQLQLALQLESEEEVQSVIDLAFDKLAGNVKVYRNSAVKSTGQAVFYTTIEPSATIIIPAGTVVSTTATSSKPAINFETISEAQMIVESIDQYFNEAMQRYEITVTIKSIEAGENTNVGVGTIVNSTLSDLQVTNDQPTQNGGDVESNTSLANRAMLAFTNLDVGTKDGYLRTAIETQYVEDVLVVDAGHSLMQRDMDPVREMHVFGKVDIYFKGDVPITYTETFGFLYEGNYREDVDVIDAADQRIQIINTDITDDSPVYLVQEVINVVKAEAYDLTGNYTLYKNAVELQKSAYSLDLETGNIVLNSALVAGDSITADYEYKIPETNETVLAAAGGGEIFVYLDIPLTLSKPANIFSEVIYLYRESTFSVSPSSNILTILPEHVYHTGDIVNIASTDSLPLPLIADTDYYIIKESNTEIKLATSLNNANMGIEIDILSSGIGSLSIYPATKITLVRDEDYIIEYDTGKVSFSFISFPSGLFLNDSIFADYDYVETVISEIITGSAVGGEINFSLDNNNIVEAFVIELDGKTINLNERNAINSTIGMLITDLIRVSYRFRKSQEAILTNQPVDEIISVTTQEGDQLIENTHYVFNKADDILLEGNSIFAVRNIQMIYDSDSKLPQGRLFDYSDEINLVSFEKKEVSKKGCDVNTVIVTNLTGTIIYELNNDYILIEPESLFNYVTIKRAVGTTIGDGDTVIVRYQYGEPITVSYNVNSLIRNVQEKVEVKRHLTADVLVKAANKIDIDLEFTIKLLASANGPYVKNELSTILFNAFNRKKMGGRVNQSDIIRLIDAQEGVDYVILPLTKMIISDGTHIAHENVPKTTIWTAHETNVVTSYKSPVNTLTYKTLGNASDSSKFWRVSQDDLELKMVDTISEVAEDFGRAYISDQGEIYLSTRLDDNPSAYLMTVAYNVSGETGANDIVTTDLDYLNLKNLKIYTI